MPYFNELQLNELETLFDLKRKEIKTLRVRDGHVTKDSKVWWRALTGPEHVVANESDHWKNIKNYPESYQLTKPLTKHIWKYLD